MKELHKPQIKWGEARAQMRITLEIFLVGGDVVIDVKSDKNDILPTGNGALLLARGEVCKELGKAADGIVKSACRNVLDLAKIIRTQKGGEE